MKRKYTHETNVVNYSLPAYNARASLWTIIFPRTMMDKKFWVEPIGRRINLSLRSASEIKIYWSGKFYERFVF